MKVCILGAGAYGLALALNCYKSKNEVIVWTKVKEELEEITTTRQNKKALPGVMIPNEIIITNELECIKDCDLVVIAVPVLFFRSTCLELKNYVHENLHYCIATKGIEKDTGLLCHEILNSIIKTENIAALSGPTFAIDLATGSPSGLTLATTSNDTYEIILSFLKNDCLKIEKRSDIIGVEICGAIKNIMAILSGILEGMQTTETTKALFLTQAMYEIQNLITILGGSSQTIHSFTGIGDLFLTCNSKKSRNFSLGILLATEEKQKVEEYIHTTTVEGYQTLVSAYQLIKQKQISSPLIETLYCILFYNQKKEELMNILIQN